MKILYGQRKWRTDGDGEAIPVGIHVKEKHKK